MSDRRSRDEAGNERRRTRGDAPKTIKQNARVHKLPTDVKAELDNRICMEESLTKLARWLQVDKGMCGDVTEDSLVTILSRYRKSIPLFDKMRVVNKDRILQIEEQLDKDIDEVDQLSRLIAIQNERIEMHMSLERQFQRTTKNASADIDLAARLCVRRHDMKMDLGVGGVGRELGTLTVRPELRARVAEKYGDDLERTISDPESSAKVVSLFEMIKRKAEKKRLALEAQALGVGSRE